MAVSTLVRMTIAGLVCAAAAYALLEMRDTGPPPRDTSAKTYFLWLMLLGPAFIGLALTGLRPMRTYLVTALVGALGLAVVAAIDNEVTNYDSAPGVILVLTLLDGFGLALPGILVAGRHSMGLHRAAERVTDARARKSHTATIEVMLRAVVPAVLCAVLTILALTADLGAGLTVLLVLALIASPAITAWLATRGGDALTYVGVGMAAAATIAIVGGVVNEARSDDYRLGIVFLGTLLVGLAFTLPPVLVAALFRR